MTPPPSRPTPPPRPLPTYTDSQGLLVTVSASLSTEVAGEVIDCINAYMEQVLTYGNSWHVIHRATILDPHCLLALVLTADYLIAAEHLNHATHFLNRAKHLLTLSGNQYSHVTRREQLYVTAWTEWVRGKKHALTTLKTLIDAYPNDLFALKKAQLIAFLSGDLPRMLSLVQSPAVRAACSKRPYYGGMVAFALEENGEVEEAERVAREAVQDVRDGRVELSCGGALSVSTGTYRRGSSVDGGELLAMGEVHVLHVHSQLVRLHTATQRAH